MKRKVCGFVALLLVLSMLCACAGPGAGSAVKLDPADYETDEKFITIADMPPNPFDPEAVKLYKDMGFTHWVLTEDHVPLVENGVLSESYQDAIELLAQEGFEVWIRNMQNDPEYFQIETEKAGSNYGYQYVLQPREITDDFQKFDAVTGFYMVDEPFQNTLQDDPSTQDREDLHPAIDQLGTLIEWKNKYYPDAFWHVNHVGSGSWNHWPAGTNYADFIDAYVENVLKKVESGGRSICMDHYPLPEGGGVIKEPFLHDVLVLAHATKNYNAEAGEDQQAVMGICLQTFQDVVLKLRDITSSSDVTLQMYTGMAAGAKLFEYFCYRSLDGVGLYGIIDMTGQKRIYDYVLEANQRAMPFEKIVCAFDWQGMTVNHGSQSGPEDLFEIVNHLLLEDTGVLTDVDSRYDTIVGCFDQNGQPGYMAVNYTAPDLDLTNIVTLTFDGCQQALVYTESGVYQQNLVDGQLRLTLPCGAAAFVIPV